MLFFGICVGVIRKLRWALAYVLVFSNAEYRIAPVDFIYSSRGRLERDRGFANPLSLSNTSPDPLGYPLRRGILAAAVDRDIGSCIPVLSLIPTSTYRLGALCSGLDCSRFSRSRWVLVARFSLLVGWTVRSCGYVVFWHNLSLGLPLTAPFFSISLDASPFHQWCRVQND